MIAEFVAVAKQKDMLKVKINGVETWAHTTANVKLFAGQNFRIGMAVELELGQEQGGLPYVTRISPTTAQPAPAPAQQASPAGQPGTCIDCGATLKDPKYKRCYDCNVKFKAGGSQTQTTQTQPDPQSYAGQPLSKTESIERQNCNNATSRALTAMVGHINPDNILVEAQKLWDFFSNKLK